MSIETVNKSPQPIYGEHYVGDPCLSAWDSRGVRGELRTIRELPDFLLEYLRHSGIRLSARQMLDDFLEEADGIEETLASFAGQSVFDANQYQAGTIIRIVEEVHANHRYANMKGLAGLRLVKYDDWTETGNYDETYFGVVTNGSSIGKRRLVWFSQTWEGRELGEITFFNLDDGLVKLGKWHHFILTESIVRGDLAYWGTHFLDRFSRFHRVDLLTLARPSRKRIPMQAILRTVPIPKLQLFLC